MAIVPMRRLSLVAHRDVQDALLLALQEAGSVHVERVDVPEGMRPCELSEDADNLQEVQYVLRFLKPHAAPAGFVDGLVGDRVPVSEPERQRRVAGCDFAELLKDVRALDAGLSEVQQKITENEALQARLAPWRDLPLDVAELRRYDSFEATLLRCGVAEFSDLSDRLAAEIPVAYLERLNSDERLALGFLVYHRASEETVNELLKNAGAIRENLAGLAGRPAAIIKTLREERQHLADEEGRHRQRAARLAEALPDLRLVYDEEQNRRRRREIQDRFFATDVTIAFEGWIREPDEEGLRLAIHRDFPEVHLALRDPLPEETPPVALANNAAFSSMELVTELYGLPNNRERDPSPLLGPFFAVFFGICLGDAGYSLVLLVLALGLKKLFPKGKLLDLLALLGGVGIVAGALMGGWFGIDVAALPAPLQSIIILEQSSEIMLFLKLAVFLGLVQLSFGICIHIQRSLRRGDVGVAVFEKLPWLIILLSVLILGFIAVPALQGLAVYAAFIAALVLLFFKSRRAPVKPAIDYPIWLIMLVGSTLLLGANWFDLFSPAAAAIGKKLIWLWLVLLIVFYRTKLLAALGRLGAGLYELYQVSGYLADALSYLRLMALGLSTGIIGMVVNLIAGLANSLVPYVGWLLALVILIVGHFFNLVMSVLGGFIHTARLQFVEFFPEFFEGGGVAFKPFGRDDKYTFIVEKEK